MRKTTSLATPVWVSFIWLNIQSTVFAATEKAGVSTTGSVLKMVLGLAVVLAVMALVSWGVKRMLPNTLGQQSAVRIVGGVSVGSRERVVVLEVAGRWIVVGVAPGQVNGLANIEAGSNHLSETLNQQTVASAESNSQVHPLMQPLVKPFAEILKKSGEKAKATLSKTKADGNTDATA